MRRETNASALIEKIQILFGECCGSSDDSVADGVRCECLSISVPPLEVRWTLRCSFGVETSRGSIYAQRANGQSPTSRVASICTRVCLPKADLNSPLEYAHASARRETSMSKHAGLFCDMSAQPVETHHSKMRLSHCNQNDSIRLWVIDCAPVTAVQSAGSNSRITRDRCGRYFYATVTWGAPDADSRLISAHVNARRLNGAMKAGERCPSRGVPAASITVGSSSSGAAENVFAPGAFRAKQNPPISTMTGTSRCDFLHGDKEKPPQRHVTAEASPGFGRLPWGENRPHGYFPKSDLRARHLWK